MAGLADQRTLADLSKKFDGRTPIRIHFLDNSSKVFLVHEYASIRDLVTQCLEKLAVEGVEEVLPYFALFESRSGSSIDNSLAMDSLVLEVLQTWSQAKVDKTAKFLFMIRLYMPCLWGLRSHTQYGYAAPKDMEVGMVKKELEEFLQRADLADANVLHLQFIQAVFNIITGKYPTTANEALQLGAIHFLFKFGPYRTDRHKPGFLGSRIVEFIPVKHLKSGGKPLGEWEAQLLEFISDLQRYYVVHSLNQGENQSEENDSCATVLFHGSGGGLISPQRKYMELVFAMEPFFGCSFYRCSQRSTRALPESVFLGICHIGVRLFDKSKKLQYCFHIEDILRWGFKPGHSFFLEIPPDATLGTGNMEFETAEGKEISDLLTDYALAFLREKERQEERDKKAPKRNKEVRKSVTSFPTTAPPPPPPTSASRPADDRRRQQAATKIQALFRGYQLRNEWAREDAAILIQSVFRGYKARVLLSRLIEEMIQNGQLL